MQIKNTLTIVKKAIVFSGNEIKEHTIVIEGVTALDCMHSYVYKLSKGRISLKQMKDPFLFFWDHVIAKKGK